MQQDNNPFQNNPDPTAATPPPVYDANMAPAAPVEPIPPRKPPVALDGVSPNYNDYIEPAPVADPVPETPEVAPAIQDTPLDDSQPQDQAFTPQPIADVEPETPADISRVNSFFGKRRARGEDFSNPVPELPDPEATAIEINPKSGGLRFRAWQFFLVLAVAIVGIVGTVFFLIEYNQINSSFQESLSQLEEYRNKADTADQATNQLKTLQSTVQEQAEKITTLQEENDTLKKTGDELKTAKEEIDKLKAEKEKLVNDYAKLVSP